MEHEIADLRHYALATCVDMLGVTAALICHEVWTYIEREFSGVGRAAGENSVDINLITFAGSLDRALTIGIVPIV